MSSARGMEGFTTRRGGQRGQNIEIVAEVRCGNKCMTVVH